MTQYKPGDRVNVTRGVHTDRRGTVIDHVKHLAALDALLLPCSTASQLRRKYEVSAGHVVVSLDECWLSGHSTENVQVPIADLQASGARA